VKSGKFETVVYELASQVGGTWCYTNESSEDQHGLPIHSSVYRNMK